MTESGSTSDRTVASADDAMTAGRMIGWLVTALGVLVIAATVGVTAYLMVMAEPGLEFVGWFFTMLFFGAFPAMMGLGLVIWGGRIVRRAGAKQRPG